MKTNLSKDILVSVKDRFNTLMEERIRTAENKEAINSISRMPFYKLKNLFESISDNTFNSDDKKHLVAEYISTIRDSKELRDIFRINETINKNNVPNEVDGSLYLSESLNIVSGMNKKKLDESMKRLRKIVENAVKFAKLDAASIDANANGNNADINESLDYLMSHKKNTSNLGTYLTEYAKVAKYINENKQADAGMAEIKEGLTLDNVIDESMESWEKNAIRDISLYSLSGKDKSCLFEDYKQECINLIEESLVDEDLENRAHLETMKLQLEGKQYNADTYIDDILKLSELKETLN